MKKMSAAVDAEISKWSAKVEELKTKLDAYETHLQNLKLLKEKVDIVEQCVIEKPTTTKGRPRKSKSDDVQDK